MFNFIVSVVFGYLLGSFPTAYLLVQRSSRIDIREAGSGNVGARNAFDVTGSKLIGMSVMIIDLLKGSAAVGLSFFLFGADFWTMAAGGLGSVLGHNFSPWLKFKGGRGLATTAGAMIVLGWIYVLVWLGLYFIAQRFMKNIHLSTIFASVIGPVFILLIPESAASSILLFHVRMWDLFIAGIVFGLIILIGHIEPLKELLKSSRARP